MISPMSLLAALLLAQTVELTDATFQTLRDAIRPKPDEVRWAQVPWRPAFWEGAREAAAADKPILLWAMNGHPLACT
jgi:hypothetical protein